MVDHLEDLHGDDGVFEEGEEQETPWGAMGVRICMADVGGIDRKASYHNEFWNH